MLRSLVALACWFMVAVSGPAFASPQADADYIAARFVTDEDFSTTLHDMAVNAHAAALSSALSTRSVQIKDHDRFVALLPNSLSDSLADGLQKAAAELLAKQWEPAQLNSVAAYLRHVPGALRIDQPDANADLGITALTIQEMQTEGLSVLESDDFTDEAALTSVAVMMFFLMVQKTGTIEIDLTAPYVAEMLEVNGVFSFPNRIVQKDLIREFRAANP